MRTFSVTLTTDETVHALKIAYRYRISLGDFLAMSLKAGIDYSSHILAVADVESDLRDIGLYEDEDDDETI